MYLNLEELSSHHVDTAVRVVFPLRGMLKTDIIVLEIHTRILLTPYRTTECLDKEGQLPKLHTTT